MFIAPIFYLFEPQILGFFDQHRRKAQTSEYVGNNADLEVGLAVNEAADIRLFDASLFSQLSLVHPPAVQANSDQVRKVVTKSNRLEQKLGLRGLALVYSLLNRLPSNRHI